MIGGDITLVLNSSKFIKIDSLVKFYIITFFLKNNLFRYYLKSRIFVVNTPFPVDRYPYYKHTILLGATRALAHIGTHFTHRVFGLSSFLAPLPGKGLD